MKALIWIGLVLAAAGCASSAEYRLRHDAQLAMYEKHASAPVDRIRTFNGIDRWESLSPDKLVIFPSVNRAYLLTLDSPCSGIEFQHTIGITSTNNTVHRRFDKVEFEHTVCFIEQINPIDYKALRKERRELAAGPE